MGKIISAATVYATAYLTEKGRTYLFNKNNIRFDSNGNDLFKIIKFTLGDPDTNYRTSQRLTSGDIPDITGKSEGCLKSTTDYVQTTLSYFTIDILSFSDPLYSINIPGNVLIINTDTALPLNQSTDVPPSPTITPGGTTLVSGPTLGTTLLPGISLGSGAVQAGQGRG